MNKAQTLLENIFKNVGSLFACGAGDPASIPSYDFDHHV
jgi:hypothetical protein